MTRRWIRKTLERCELTTEACTGHWRQPVAVGGTTVLCSAYLSHGGVSASSDVSGAGFYLDGNWARVLTDATWPYKIIDWPDFGVIQADELRELVDEISALLEQRKVVEIGCLGGHGRTGTLLAALIARVEGCDAENAMVTARERYCHKAIETQQQRELIHRASREE